MNNCALIREAVERFYSCVETDRGLRVSTDCLYPSFSRVFVYVVKQGDSFLVHDNGEAAARVWEHGRDLRRPKQLWEKTASRFDCEVDNLVFKCVAQSSDWLAAAILSVANASAAAANTALERDHSVSEVTLVDRIEHALERNPKRPIFDRRTPILGKSGRTYEFEFSIKRAGAIVTLIDTVTPHHNSIAAKYVAFDDTERRPALQKFAVFERELDKADKVLLQNVADLIPIDRVEATLGAAFIAN